MTNSDFRSQSRSKLEDPEQLKLKQKAKEMQRAEQEEVRQREANETALMAIGNRRKKLKTDQDASTGASFEPSSQIGFSSRFGVGSTPGRSTVSVPSSGFASVFDRQLSRRSVARNA